MRKINLVCFLAVVLFPASPVVCAQSKGDADKGNEIFDEQCASCHNAYSTDRKTGPGLKWLFSKGKLESNGKPADEANILQKIDAGGKGMPAFKDTLSKDDKADLIAYLKTL
jgi:mono/diheme cytochrome c family protein